jgi:radical SAM-linked protein
MQIDQMPMARVFYAKKGRARYTSHLDVMRMFTRAFRRSGLPLWHTQGFNPHVYMMFALPLALGYESECETLDIRLTENTPLEEVTARLNAALPEGFSALRAAAPVLDPKEIALADYAVEIKPNPKEQFKAFMEQPKIEVLKKGKKGDKLVDIKPLSELLEADTQGDTLNLKLRMAAGITLNINPTLLLNAFYEWAGFAPEAVKITRNRILTADLRDFAGF